MVSVRTVHPASPRCARVRTCPSCQRTFPEVEGVDVQQCPHCGHEARTRAPGAANTPAAVDPAGAAAHAFRFTGKRYVPLLLLWLPAGLVDLTGSLALVAYQVGASIPDDLTTLTLSQQMRFLGVALPIMVTVYAAKLAAWAGVAAYVGDSVDPRGGHAAALRGRGLQVMMLGFALALAYVAGLLLLVVPFLVFFHWFLFAPAALAEPGRSVGGALDASRRFAKERRTFGFTALVLFVLAGLFIAYLVLAVAFLSIADAFGGASEYVAAALQALAAWLVSPLASVLPASFYWLAKQAPTERPVDPAAPLADRFRTTKCPGCGTLVPYTATGQPVEVTCPVCGRTGKVL